jgi:hypothetical protein
MAKANQIIAVEKGLKTRSFQELSESHHELQKPASFTGLTRTYQPLDDAGEKFAPEKVQIQANAESIIRKTADILSGYFDIVATKDWTNCKASADVVVDGKKLLSNVPVTYLLFLEKQLVDMMTFVKKLPTLDASESWKFDPNSDSWTSEPTQTTKTKKIPRAFVKYEATKEHPAQVDVVHEDIVVGNWTQIKFSGALPAKRVNELVVRVEKLQKAVKFAREEANSIEAEDQKIGSSVFNFLFANN